MTVRIRRAAAADEARWRELWAGYCEFYGIKLAPEITRSTWQRIVQPEVPVHAVVAEAGGAVMGFANYVIHANTWNIAPVCYLEDLFVDPACRAVGVGQQILDWLLAEMQTQGWARVYWHTRETNYRARGLYDKYGAHSDFVRYAVHRKGPEEC